MRAVATFVEWSRTKGSGLTMLRQKVEILGCAAGPLKLMRPQGFFAVHLFLSNNVSNTQA